MVAGVMHGDVTDGGEGWDEFEACCEPRDITAARKHFLD
jgi:hypothetical protein